jgi:nucleoside-diphosphate-sugar epimerase
VKVLVAGASGALGRRLVPLLLAAGYEVIGTTRREEHATALRAAGAEAIVCDLLEPGRAREVVEAAHFEAIVDELTSFPQEYDPRRASFYDPTNRVRRDGTAALLDAALAAGVQRYLLQSVAFVYAPEGAMVQDEDGRLWTDAPPPFDTSVRVLALNERKVTGTPGIDGLVLRYGAFYGPGTYYASDGSIADQVRARRYPVVGRGGGITSFVHVADAAAATVCALERGAPGIYNLVDDEPAAMRDWLPHYAAALGAKRPHRVPAFVARLVAGRGIARAATELRGASNAKAKRELGWMPRVPSWREGFGAWRDADPPVA